ncbi:c-type cytochrome [Rubripirellula lacrimiformis]|uniref:c-type cytochrome n=1 Tax=Rubripirellula lacrimiformis TaxID=1930273 RepID=UPI0011A5DC8A|nr:c-type cytochrome [Rubripirellula lacrimiformis]
MRFYVCLLMLACGTPVVADDHNHGGAADTAKAKAEAPVVFLDKSPRIVAYQLKRLDNARLLMVPRKTDDAKYIPVYSAILSRPGMPAQFREEAVAALSKLDDVGSVSVLIDAMSRVDGDDQTVQRTRRELAKLLLGLPVGDMQKQSDALIDATSSDDAFAASAGFAGLVMAGKRDLAMQMASKDDDTTLAWLNSVSLMPTAKRDDAVRKSVVATIQQTSTAAVQSAAVRALGLIPQNAGETFQLVAPMVGDEKLRPVAVKTLLRIDSDDRDQATATALLSQLVSIAEATQAKDRTSGEFTDAMQLADSLMATVDADAARDARSRLGAITVRMIRIKTVEEEMRYDITYFAVEAGRPVQVVLENHDLMPHNLVISTPGTLKEVAQKGLEAGPSGVNGGLPYVPESDMVLEATPMVAAHDVYRLTFTAPTEPGEYPFVCTFPQHWYRMYGVMVVVEDLDAWLKDPVEPANPIGSNRTFVQSWTIDDFQGEMENGLVGRSPEIGQRIFAEASCAGCHKVSGQGGVIGPDLTDVLTRWKGDRMGVLKEILDPSHKIDEKYLMQRILTVDGRTITGVLVKEDDDNVSLMPSAEAKAPIVVAQDDIEAMVPSSVSMMPKALMDQYTKDEVFELMSYLENPPTQPAP